MDLYLQSYNHAIELWHMATLSYGHTTITISSPWEECMWTSAVESKTFNANFVHKVAYISQSIQVMITFEGPRPGIGLEICPQGEHATTITQMETNTPLQLENI